MKHQIMLVLAVIGLVLASGCSIRLSKEGYVVKDYPFGSTAEKTNGVEVKAPEPKAEEPKEEPKTTTTTPKTSTSTSTTTKQSTSTGTSTTTTTSSKILTPKIEKLNFNNVNTIEVLGTKSIELTVGNNIYLFSEPRTDEDGEICIIAVNGQDRIAEEGQETILNGISIELTNAFAAREVSNNFCEFVVRKT